MCVNQINFGKILKINAPNKIATEIQEIANGKKCKRKKLINDINVVLPDIEYGKAETFYWDRHTTFIFSGNEANAYNSALIQNKTNDASREKISKILAENYHNIRVIDPIYEKDKLISLNLEM